MPHQTYSNLQRKIPPGSCLNALHDSHLGHPASLLCWCAQLPGIDRRGQKKKNLRRWGGEDGRQTNSKCSGKTRDKTSSPHPHSSSFSTSSIRCTSADRVIAKRRFSPPIFPPSKLGPVSVHASVGMHKQWRKLTYENW